MIKAIADAFGMLIEGSLTKGALMTLCGVGLFVIAGIGLLICSFTHPMKRRRMIEELKR